MTTATDAHTIAADHTPAVQSGPEHTGRELPKKLAGAVFVLFWLAAIALWIIAPHITDPQWGAFVIDTGLLLASVGFAAPFISRLKSLGVSMEEAAATLGANAWQTFWRVTAPLMAPGIVAAALFAFAISFDQFVISYFLAPVGVSTLPVEIYSAIRKGFTPEINAISTIIILASMALMIGFARFSKFGGER